MTSFEILKLKHNFYKLRETHKDLIAFSDIETKFNSMSQFKDIESDNFKLPVIITGRLVTADKYTENGALVDLPADELKKTLSDWVGIKIYKTHSAWRMAAMGQDVPIDQVIGKITSTIWNDKDKGIDFTAEISDRDIAFKIAQDLIDSVSVGFTKDLVWANSMPMMTNIIPRELSCVMNPRDKRAKIKVKELVY